MEGGLPVFKGTHFEGLFYGYVDKANTEHLNPIKL